jgi:glycosyltransferase involved in cell wall biosynthesis
MRVVHIETGRHLYGGGRQVRYLIAGLAARGVTNALVCVRGGALATNPPPAEVVPLAIGGDLDFRAIGRLRRALRALAPDLVHVHSRRGAELFGGVASALESLPAVLTRRVDSSEPKLWARLKYARYGAVIALSVAIERQLVSAGIARDTIHRIPSAVDLERYRPDVRARERLRSAYGLPEDALVIGVVAQLIARKRHAWLIEALPELIHRWPTVRVLSFGRGPLAAKLETRVGALGLQRHVRFAGFRDDLPALLPGFDVLAHPAEREGLGVALLESASCGVPVVACAVGGVVDVVRHERTGLLVPADDPAAFRRALEHLLRDADERRRLGDAARADVAARFGVEALVTAHERVYSAVLARARQEPAAVSPAVERGGRQ